MTNATLTTIANDYIDDTINQQALGRDAWLAAQRDLYRRNASHLSDCFADTAAYAEGESFTQAELEAEIVRIIMDGQAW
ncbi:hypothetical protein LJC46_08630 [Desulfovibrio sp. OttesenSCG-928-G15]|nr:hypothetical protein [Desulfovibrio sp. OttesenSCG-928-G15]